MNNKPSPYSALLVIAQFSLIALLLVIWFSAPREGLLALFARLIMLLSVCLAGWALITMRLSNFSVFPEPSARGRLTEAGPYRYVRHPMYTAVLLIALAVVIAADGYVRFVLFIALTAVMLLKTRQEEFLLLAAYPEYASYQQRSKALMPLIL